MAEEVALRHWLESYKPQPAKDKPNYYDTDPGTLISDSQPVVFTVGTGAHVLSSVLESCLCTNQELIIVTCFWAESKSRDDVAALLRNLSTRALSQSRRIRVRLCFSSMSLVQKLFQTSSRAGTVYGKNKWTGIGLPDPEELEGLEMVVKSIFVRPFSVMHPKFILIVRGSRKPVCG